VTRVKRYAGAVAAPSSSQIPTRKLKKNLIERAYCEAAKLGLAVWTEDEAGPYPTRPYPGHSWAEQGQPKQQPHEYVRNGTAKLLTLFCPGSGEVRARGVTHATNAVLHPWLQQELAAILQRLPQSLPVTDIGLNHVKWESWQQGLQVRITLPPVLPALRLLLVWDNLQGHWTPDLIGWLFSHGVMPLYTPLGGSWLNMAESMQRIVVRRALAGQYPQTPEQIIAALEATVNAWNQSPTPFHWGGKRYARRNRQRQRQHALGGSGACTRYPIRARPSKLKQYLNRAGCQVTH
jgi:transposase